jgi:Uma2 family endonuclease
MAAIPFQREIDYPESDGRPLGETERHRQEIVDLIYGLQQHFSASPDVYVGGNMFIYTSALDRRKSVCPDVFVAKGVGKHERRTFRLWEEAQGPCLVIEVTSESTRDEDMEKKEKYARLGVAEYFLFDPFGEYLSPRLQGFRLRRGGYLAIPRQEDGSLASESCGLILQPEGDKLRLVNAVTGEPLPWVDEIKGLLEAAQSRAAAEAQGRRRESAARQAAEARAAAAEEKLARLLRQLGERDPDA